MKIKLRTFILGWVVLLLLILWMVVKCNASFADKVDLRGCSVSTKSMSIWQLHKFKDTALMRMSPLIWCPWRAYVAVDRYVSIECKDNRNWLVISTDLIELLKPDIYFNKYFASGFKVHGSQKSRIRQIYRYCKQTQYVPHVKTAKDVFTHRQGDCAAISAAFYVLCQAKHIPVRYVIGWTSEGCHAWNRVKVGKRWYWIDCTMGKWIQRRQFKHRKIMNIW